MLLISNPRSKKKEKAIPKKLTYAEVVNRPYVEFTDNELIEAAGGTLVFDIETYPNYFLIAFKDIEQKKIVTFECPHINRDKLNWVANHFRLLSFNGLKFDAPLMWLAIYGKDVTTLKSVADKLILGLEDGSNYRNVDVAKEFGVVMPRLNHVDLIEVAPLKASLKTYSGRLHAPRMQDLPYPPDKVLTEEEKNNVKFYCVNDLDNTELLYRKLEKQIKLREQLSQDYKQDLRSLSDAQIAEHVLSAECAKLNGYYSKRPVVQIGSIIKYNPPSFIHFLTPKMQEMFEGLLASDFVISEKGSPKNEYLKGLKINIGEQSYRMGVGGLHSTESCITHRSENGFMLIDRDVASYYPYIILNNGYYPKHLTENFLKVYKSIVDRRIEAKGLTKHENKEIANMNKIIADSLKITINGSFGKLGSKWSKLYSPDLLIQVTVTGQLCLLMLIEYCELCGIQVVSANTDGVVFKCHESQYDQLNDIIKQWEQMTNFETEETRYKAVHSRDVNNYVAIKTDGETKGKGVFGETDLKKQPNAEILAKAVTAYLKDGIPVRETIEGSADIRDFIVCKVVKGGAHKNDLYLGKAIRWYYAKGMQGTINYVINGNTVGGSEGGKPIMDLPEHFPEDIDYELYVNMANDMLSDMGVFGGKSNKRADLFSEGKRDNW